MHKIVYKMFDLRSDRFEAACCYASSAMHANMIVASATEQDSIKLHERIRQDFWRSAFHALEKRI